MGFHWIVCWWLWVRSCPICCPPSFNPYMSEWPNWYLASLLLLPIIYDSQNWHLIRVMPYLLANFSLMPTSYSTCCLRVFYWAHTFGFSFTHPLVPFSLFGILSHLTFDEFGYFYFFLLFWTLATFIWFLWFLLICCLIYHANCNGL